MSISFRGKFGLCKTEQQATDGLAAEVVDLVWGSVAVWCVIGHTSDELFMPVQGRNEHCAAFNEATGLRKSIGDMVRCHTHVHNVRLAGRSNQIIYAGLWAGGLGCLWQHKAPTTTTSPPTQLPTGCTAMCIQYTAWQPSGRGMARKLDLTSAAAILSQFANTRERNKTNGNGKTKNASRAALLLCNVNELTALGKSGLTSHQTHYRSYRGRVLRVKWPKQRCQSTEGKEGPKDTASIPSGATHRVTLQHIMQHEKTPNARHKLKWI